MLELRQLASIVNPVNAQQAIRGLPIVVTHIKPTLAGYSNDGDSQGLNDLAYQAYN